MKIIAAVGKNGIMGIDNKLIASYPEDMLYFKTITNNSTVIMGRKTYESIGKPLKNRNNIVISSTNIPNVINVNNFQQAIIESKNFDNDCWVIGGASVYKEALKFATEIHLTIMKEQLENENLNYIRFPWIDPTEYKIQSIEPLPKTEYNRCMLAIYSRT